MERDDELIKTEVIAIFLERLWSMCEHRIHRQSEDSLSS